MTRPRCYWCSGMHASHLCPDRPMFDRNGNTAAEAEERHARLMGPDCPSCHGEGHHGIEQDSGNPFTCYLCGGMGWVTEEVATSYRLDQRYARADAEVREDWDEGSRMARSEYAGLMDD